MKLLSRVRKLADRAGRRGPAEPVGLVWSRRESRLPDGYEFGPGEHLAVDVYQEAPAAGELPERQRTVERASAEPGDLGRVYGAAGELLGRVVEVRDGGCLLRIEYFEAAHGGGAGAATRGAGVAAEESRSARTRRAGSRR